MFDNLKESALGYARRGWKVLPLIPREKKPATEHGLKDATSDPEQITRWWTDNPNYNIGVVTGEESKGLYVIDIDEDTEKGKHGLEVFKKWQEEHGEVNTGVVCATPRGGKHLYFYNHDQLKNTAGIGDCIDTRANGGYIVAPPSIHPNGKRYCWVQSPEYNMIAELPRVWVDYVTNYRKPKEKQEKKEKDTPPRISQGSRTQTLISKIGELCNTTLDKKTIKETVRALNATFDPPLTDEELNKEVFPSLDRGWQEETVPEFKPISANDLLKKEIPPLKFIIGDICPAGVGVLCAPPKYYKSFLALQICIAVSRGEKIFDHPAIKTDCIYFDLESSDRRPQNRLKNMWVEELHGVDFMTQDEMPKKNHRMVTLATGFDLALEKYLQEHPSVGFVVIDVFGKIRTEQKKTQSLYEHDYEDISKLQTIASKHNVCIFMLHHTTKGKDENDPFNNMGGSSGLLGALDFAWVISKDARNDKQATLHITGRDIESAEYSIEFDKTGLFWKYNGTAEEVQAQKEFDDFDHDAITQTIRKLVDDNHGTWTGTTSDIIKYSEYLPKKIRNKSQQVGRYIQTNAHLLALADDIEVDYHASANARLYTFTKKKKK